MFDKNSVLKEKYGDSLITVKDLVIGVCECKGRGKGRCIGNGWARHLKEPSDEDLIFNFNKCKYIKTIDNEEDIVD